MPKTVYQTDRDGYFVGAVPADPDPQSADAWLIPYGCVEAPPPEAGQGQIARFVGDAWQLVAIPSTEPEPQPEPEAPSVDDLRRSAYQMTSDPVFFKWQRGEATQQDWLTAVAQVRAQYPAAGT